MSAFGSSTQQPGQSGGMFGGLGSNTQQPSSNIFGTTTNAGAAGSSGGLFGGTSTTGTGGGLFASTNTNTQNQGGGLFASTNTNTQNQGGGLFGTPNSQQQPSGSSVFGATNTQQQQSSSGGLFGSTTTNAQPSSGLFGSTNTSTQQPNLTLNTGGGLFGNTNTNTNTTSTSNNPLFGNKPPNSIFGTTSTTNPNPANPLFGGGGGAFGNTNMNTQQQQPNGGALFGSTNIQQQQPQQGGGLFGSTTTQQQQPSNGLFGQSQQQQPTSSIFGSTNTNPLTVSALNPPTNPQGSGGLFGSTLASVNNFSSTARGPGGEMDAQSQFSTLQQRIERIAAAWNPQSSDCRFQHYFYNLVDPAQVNLYGRPPNATNEALWQKAIRENPDRSYLVPVVAVGFDDLRQRVEAQSQQAAAHQGSLKELKARIEALSQRHAISNSSRLSRASTTQTQITHRLLKLIQHLHLLIPALRSSAIRPEEEALRVKLEEIEDQIRRGRLRGKLNELWAVVGALLNGARGSRDGTGGTEWAVVDEEGLAQIAQILAEEQAGLQHLTKILQRDLKDLGVIQGKGGEQDGDDILFSSTSTVRATS